MLNNPVVRYAALGIGALLVICLLGALLVRFAPASLPFIGGGGAPPIPTPISMDMETGEPTGEVEGMATPPMVAEEPTSEPEDVTPVEVTPEEPTAEAVEVTPLPTSTPVPIAMDTPPAEEGPTPFTVPEGEGEPTATSLPTVIAQVTEPAVPETGAELSLARKPAAQDEERGELILNGDFEGGFTSMGVGNHWETFHNGAAFYGWYDDTWLPVVISGTHTQLIEIARSTENDRYSGIYQTVQTVPGATYDFSISGMVRTLEGDVELTDYGYRILIGFEQEGGGDWHTVEDWIELPWGEQLRIMETFRKDYYATPVTAEGDRLTVFIRCWKKWADSGEGDFDVDNISLVGLLPSAAPAAAAPASPQATVEAAAPETPQATAEAAAPVEPTAQLPVSGAKGEGLAMGTVSRWAAIVIIFILSVAVVAWRTVDRRRA
jgi:hypothetical protein